MSKKLDFPELCILDNCMKNLHKKLWRLEVRVFLHSLSRKSLGPVQNPGLSCIHQPSSLTLPRTPVQLPYPIPHYQVTCSCPYTTPYPVYVILVWNCIHGSYSDCTPCMQLTPKAPSPSRLQQHHTAVIKLLTVRPSIARPHISRSWSSTSPSLLCLKKKTLLVVFKGSFSAGNHSG